MTELTSRRVHEAMVAGANMDEFIAELPDDLQDWVLQVVADIDLQVHEWNRQINTQWRMVVAECEERSAPAAEADEDHLISTDEWPLMVSMGMATGSALTREQREMFASIAQRYPFAWALLSRLDGEDYQARLLENAVPPEIDPPGEADRG